MLSKYDSTDEKCLMQLRRLVEEGGGIDVIIRNEIWYGNPNFLFFQKFEKNESPVFFSHGYIILCRRLKFKFKPSSTESEE